MPAEPQRVALYLNHLAADGKAIATIAQARSAISHAHAAQGIPQTETSASRSPQPPAAPPRARSAITTTTCSPTRRQQPSQDHDPSGQRKPHPALSQQQRPGTAPGLPREPGALRKFIHQDRSADVHTTAQRLTSFNSVLCLTRNDITSFFFARAKARRRMPSPSRWQRPREPRWAR